MLTLGTTLDGEESVELTADDVVRHLALFGKSGTGKSTLLRAMFIERCWQGSGVAVIDPHGQLVRQLLNDVPQNRLDDVVYLDLADPDYTFGINLFEAAGSLSPAEKTQRVNQVTDVFKKVSGANWGALLENWLPVIAHTFLDAGEGTLADVPRLLSDRSYRDRLLRKLTNNYVRTYWQRHVDKNGMVPNDEVDSTLRRFGKFLMNPLLEQIFGQEETTIPFQEIMDAGKILLVTLPNDDADTTALLGTVIFQRLFNATVRRRSENPFVIIADECQLVTTPDLARFIDEARKRNVGIVLATQRPGKIADDAVEEAMMNVGTLLTLAVDYDDAVKLGRRFPGLAKPQGQYVAIPQEMTTMSAVRQNGHPNPYVVSLVAELDTCIQTHLGWRDHPPILTEWQRRDSMARYDDLIEWHQTHTDPGRVLGTRLLTADMNHYHPELYQRVRVICQTLYPLLQNEPVVERIKDYKPPPASETLQTLEQTHGWGTAAVRTRGEERLIAINWYEADRDNGHVPDLIARSRRLYYRPRAQVAAEIQRRFRDDRDDDEGLGVPSVPKRPAPRPPITRWPA